MAEVWKVPAGSVHLDQLGDGRSALRVELDGGNRFSARTECETAYSAELIKLILDAKGAEWLCDEIARDEDPVYVQKYLANELSAYFDLEQFSQSRILDFGCGCGASTMWLARQFPRSEIVGVELKDDFLAIAKARAEHYGYANVKFFQSPGGSELPADIGQFDIVIMSAVYEHLLPAERKVILGELWSCVREGGFLFLNQTPNSLFPIELHTTMLPLINYIPDSLAFAAAKRFSKRVEPEDSWDELLRKGIRGATVREITGNLGEYGSAFTMLEPTRRGFADRVDLWFSTTNTSNMYSLKKLAKVTLKGLYKLTGLAMIPDLALAFKKKSSPPVK